MTKSNGHIFISYAREDRGKVTILAQLFEAEGWSVWWDRDNMSAGQPLSDIIETAIDDSSCVVVCWSMASIKSRWVKDEATEGLEQEKIVPVLFEKVKPPFGFRSIHNINLSEWDNQATHEDYDSLKSAISQKQQQSKAVKPAQTSVTAKSAHSKEIQTLLDKLTDPSIEPAERLVVGDKLAVLGDPRPGVGLDADGIPDIDWVEIPGGEFLYGEEKKPASIDTFYMARYPITNAQYDAFINDGGYGNERWWEGLSNKKGKPKEPRWKQANRPRESVNWYEAIAFCRWLGYRLRFEVSLATEQQWERVARGTDGREYPWGDEYQSGYANINEKQYKAGPYYLEQTSSVGMYNFAGSPEDIQDLSGNVWEWVLKDYGNPENISTEGDGSRVLRGGSWLFNPDFARASIRYRFNPDSRLDYLGFRVVCSSPIAR